MCFLPSSMFYFNTLNMHVAAVCFLVLFIVMGSARSSGCRRSRPAQVPLTPVVTFNASINARSRPKRHDAWRNSCFQGAIRPTRPPPGAHEAMGFRVAGRQRASLRQSEAVSCHQQQLILPPVFLLPRSPFVSITWRSRIKRLQWPHILGL